MTDGLYVVQEDRLKTVLGGMTLGQAWKLPTNEYLSSQEEAWDYLTEGIPEGLLEEMANMLDDAEYALRAHIRPNESIANSVRNGVRALLTRYRQATRDDVRVCAVCGFALKRNGLLVCGECGELYPESNRLDDAGLDLDDVGKNLRHDNAIEEHRQATGEGTGEVGRDVIELEECNETCEEVGDCPVREHLGDGDLCPFQYHAGRLDQSTRYRQGPRGKE